MKKRLFGMAMAGLLAASAVGLAACGSNKGENELWITYYKGGYGTEWVEQLARKFEKEHEGIKVVTDADTSLIDAVPNMMENGTDYDLIFCHDVAWEDFVQPGWIHSLDNLYAKEVEYKGEKVTFKDRIWDEDVLDSCTYRTSDGKEHYYKVPWTIGTAGIAYNVTIMDRIDAWFETTSGNNAGQTYLASTEGGGDTNRRWNRKPPVSYYDLIQYCKDVNAARLRAGDGDSDSAVIKPFTWSGKSEEWQWDYVLFDWWGQLAGPETMNSFKNFGDVVSKDDLTLDWTKVASKNPSKEVYNPDKAAVVRNEDGTVNKEQSTYIGWKEFSQAYTLWYNLVAGHKEWSDSAVGSYGKFENEQAFASGLAAMTPAACWIENESKIYLENSGQTVSIMPTPTISEVRLDANGNVLDKSATTYATTLDAIRADANATEKVIEIDGKKYNRVSFTSSFGDSVMIPEKATQKELAEEFILFMQREENAQLFTRTSGGTVLPYKYEYWNSFVDDNGEDKATLWQKSIFEIDQNSTKFNNYTKHPMMRNTMLKGSARMTSVWPTNVYYYYKAWQSPDSYKPSKLLKTDIYEGIINQRWDVYKRAL